MKTGWLWMAPALALVLLACPAAEEGAPAGPGAPTVHPEAWPTVESPLAPDPELERRVSDLLGRMTLEEKVGQLIQAEIVQVSPEEVAEYHLGSVLNGGNNGPGGDEYAPPEKWLELADRFWEASMDESDGHQAIPILWGLDAVHGHTNVVGATIFPHNIGLGAAHNPELVRRIGEITALEIAVTGQEWDFSPTVAVARDDRWGRSYESYSEDPEIVAAYAGKMVEGLQGAAGSDGFLAPGRVLATAKHFLGDGGTHRGVDQGDNRASEAELRDIHAAGYVTAIAAGVQTVMASYNSWHGEKMHGHAELLTGVLKQRMGFDGFVVGDWNGHSQVAGCATTSCAAAVNAGVDMFMVPADWRELYANTLEQARSGEIPGERLDDAVRRILRVKMRAGLFDRGRPSSRGPAGRFELLGAPEHRAAARQAVRESLVLLKNNGSLLPLPPRQRVLVAGPGADDLQMQSGGWTLTWQGTGNQRHHFPGATSIWEGIREAVESAGGAAELSPDGAYEERPDVAVVVYGETPYAEFLGDRENVDYAPDGDRDLELLRRLGGEGIPVVSVFLSGRPLWVNPELNASDAFVAAWLPGSEGGGVADVLFRAADGSVRHDFTGRLSFSWPRVASGEPLNRHDPEYDPLFPYGYGLSTADVAELAELSEDDGIDPSAPQARSVYLTAGGPVPPWRLYLGDATDPAVLATGESTATRASEHLVVRVARREEAGDALVARWSGEADARLYLRSGVDFDLRRESNADMSLAFDLRLDEPARGEVTLGMGCGDGCAGSVDLTEPLAALPAGEWQTVRVRLSCFERAGVDMGGVDTSFRLETGGALTLGLSNIRLVTAADGPAICPPAPGGGTD
ncbi:MAG: exo 1,3/1,4-beta-D-glucan glucohydrolase [Thermoanaerobaculia bacterium]|nr:exo 1,3/1,4-beta-D-glucan glucohydrolase [Thermoanaerobaculia bacterium]